jgi:UDP-glucose:(heptosyl)LPS alpha-1,3-glucosyltransferase
MHAASDLFVLPTQYEAFALSIIEALASGLPVITTKVPGASDRVVDMHNGRLLDDPRSSNELADLLGQAMDSDVRTLWADNAAQSVADLSWSALFDKAERLLESLPSRSLGAAPPGDHLVTGA